MFPTLQVKLARYEELERMLQDPVILADTAKMLDCQREHGGLGKIARSIREFNQLEGDVAAVREMIESADDAETREYAQAELSELQTRYDALRTELEDMVTAGDSLTRGSLIMEIRAGTGGDEAALFARDLFDMYTKFVEKRGWKFEVLELSANELGGMKEVVLSITGEAAFHQLQFESGGHRVQRVPETETQGRVHTSAATVAVMPEATDIDVEIRDEDLQIDTMRAGGPGGQKVNKTESAVRITHVPTGIVVRIQDEKSQHKNKAKAMRVLRSKLMEARQATLDKERSAQRRTLIGSGDRSERIRTYNFPQNRLTDHRINLTVHKLDQIIQGDLDEVVQALVQFDREERLRGGTALA
ncbi:peptide chain release factor 1 [Schlesneria paludicola]|uniref:peptide chain release factor 1 n=1 Tax=Schlesneria paludicola TaxID=360056 RepID=UPI00029A0EAC|nr:peptide chain release factor 1 [Schlesneria paludicola]